MSLAALIGQMGLRPEQKVSADLIVDLFSKAGLSSGITLAAMANAYAESMLDPLVCYGRTPWSASRAFGPIDSEENSCGLFQLNAANGAAGEGLSVEERQNPQINIGAIIDVIQSSSGDRLRQASANNENLSELIFLFTVDIERPANSDSKGNERISLAEGWGWPVFEPVSRLPIVGKSSNYFFFGGITLLAVVVLLVASQR